MGFSLMSVIIPTLNEEAILGVALESLKKQSFQNYEVVIADGGSTDRTMEIAEEYGCRFLKVPKTRPHDVSTAKNMGSKYAYGDALFFLDADMSLDPNAFEVIDEEYDDVSLIDRRLSLVLHLPPEVRLGPGLEPARIDNGQLAVLPGDIGVDPVAGGAGDVLDDSEPLAHQPVEQG